MADDTDWKHQTMVEAKMLDWCDQEWSRSPGRTSVQNHVRQYIDEWDEQRNSGTE